MKTVIKIGIAILISDNGNINVRTRHKDRHFMIIKGSIQQVDMIINIRAFDSLK